MKRKNELSPAQEIAKALAAVSEELKDVASLVAEYATNFCGQTKAEMDSAAVGLRTMRYDVVKIMMRVEDAEEGAKDGK